jgi:DNA-binding IclR family transcriptional regulator
MSETNKMDKDPDFVTSLARGFSILTCFQATDAELGNGEIAERAGLPPATVARLTYTLTQLGYLRSIPLRRKYALSANVLSIGYPVLAALPERELARIHVKRLADETGGSVCLAICEGLQAVYVEASRGADAGQFPDIGTHRHVLDSSVGRALFVSMGAAQQLSTLNQLCLISPQRAEELRAAAQTALDEYSRFGVCRSESLAIKGWSGIAIPIEGLARRRLALSLGLRTQSLEDNASRRSASLALAATASRIAEAFKSFRAERPC